ncbi:efflux RND transporter periplasmic adaptor subunit [Candidatus Woesearchaeota archaeon]|nr:efflux RND transporter periplasmic adaptor subunit [Candidatus Woesearchaeota archaeon]
MKISKKVSVSIVIILAVVAAYLLFFNKPKKEEAATYRTEAVTIGDVRLQVVTSGTLSAITLVQVGSQVSGKIISLYADFNDKVKKGDKLAELDQESINQQIRQQEANYLISKTALDKAKLTRDNAKIKYNRSKQLFDKELLSVEELEAAEITYQNSEADVQSADARLKQSEAQLEAAKVDLTHTVIRSPIDGIVINRAVNVGQTVTSGMQTPVLYEIANDLSKMQLACNVDETDIGKVEPGQNVQFTVSAYPRRTFTGKVIQKRLKSESTSNVVTYPAIIHVENSDGALMPGMTATVTIISAEAKGALLVPGAALRFTPTQQAAGKAVEKKQAGSASAKAKAKPQQADDIGTVWKLDSSGNPAPVSVRTGVADSTKTEVKEVLSGELKEGDLVIVGLNPAKQTTQSQQPSQIPGMGGVRR